jgi:hypothetical protein
MSRIGIVGGHLHDVVGASTFGVTFSDAIWSKAKCSTMQIQENKSNYWMPALMAQHDNGTFSAIPFKEARVYYLNNVSISLVHTALQPWIDSFTNIARRGNQIDRLPTRLPHASWQPVRLN